MTIETPGKLNLTIARGIDFAETLTFADNGDPMDLTDYTVFAEARKQPSTTAAFSLGATITDAAGGIIALALDSTATDALTPGTYGWDLVLEDGSGTRSGPYLAGTVRVETLHTQP